MSALPEKSPADARPAPITELTAQGWPEDALQREAALIAAASASRARFIALLDAIRG